MTTRVELTSLFKFLPQSKLGSFIRNKRNIDSRRQVFTLAEILNHLKDIITEERLYDPNNRKLIVCSPELENVFEMKALHDTQLTRVVRRQLVQTCQAPPPAGLQDDMEAAKGPEDVGPVLSGVKFLLQPGLRAVLQTLPVFDPDQTSFTYFQIQSLVFDYIKVKNLLVPNNTAVAFVRDDPLGKLFQVQAFHRAQADTFIQRHLLQESTITLAPASPTATTTSESTEGELANQPPLHHFHHEFDPPLTDSEPEGCPVGFDSQHSSSSCEEGEFRALITADTHDYLGDNEEDPPPPPPPPCPSAEDSPSKFNCVGCNRGKTDSKMLFCLKCWKIKQNWKEFFESKQAKKKRPPRPKRRKLEDLPADCDGPLCIMCQTRAIDTVFKHGRTGHMVVCYPCGKATWRKNPTCPICKRTIGSLVKVFRNHLC